MCTASLMAVQKLQNLGFTVYRKLLTELSQEATQKSVQKPSYRR